VVSRRAFLKGLLAVAGAGAALGSYAFAVEPMWRLRVQRYAISPRGWPRGLRLRATVIADLHAADPVMPLSRVRQIVSRANALEADVHLLLGDYAAGHRFVTRKIAPMEWAEALAGLKAPLGTHAVLGNHDWWDDEDAQGAGKGPVEGRRALERYGVPVYENDVVRLTKNGQPFWLAGLGDQIALILSRRRHGPGSEPEVTRAGVAGRERRMHRQWRLAGVDDLPGTLAQVTDDAPVIMMAHEPDIFAEMPDRVAVTVSGHTHGGQVRLLGYSPVVPSQFGNRYAYGHIVEHGRHLVVSGGLGCSLMPVRFGVPPEIVVLDIAAA